MPSFTMPSDSVKTPLTPIEIRALETSKTLLSWLPWEPPCFWDKGYTKLIWASSRLSYVPLSINLLAFVAVGVLGMYLLILQYNLVLEPLPTENAVTLILVFIFATASAIASAYVVLSKDLIVGFNQLLRLSHNTENRKNLHLC